VETLKADKASTEEELRGEIGSLKSNLGREASDQRSKVV